MPGRNTSFSIGDHFLGFVDAQVKEGRYSNASDVLRAALAGDDTDVVRNLHERMDFLSLA